VPGRSIIVLAERLALAAAVLAASVVVPASPTSALTKDDGLGLVVPVLAPMLPGQQGWISALWTANQDVCDVRVTVAGPGIIVSYPSNTGDYTSLYTSWGLATGNLDYTAFNVTVPATVTAAVPLTLRITYQLLPPGQIKKDDDLRSKKFDCQGPKGEQTVTASLPVQVPTGDSVVQRTTTASVARTAPGWVRIVYAGRRAVAGPFRVTVGPVSGLAVSYPGDAKSTGLDAATVPRVGREDYVAVHLDASGVPPGAVRVPVHATWASGRLDGELVVTVT
jgi:hypothetical protein